MTYLGSVLRHCARALMQVYISMGQKPSFALLANYGFADPENTLDSLAVGLQLEPDDPFLDTKTKMLERLGTYSASHPV